MGSDWQRGLFSKQDGVSIHAPAWGATFDFVNKQSSCVGFNPRSRMGSDKKSLPRLKIYQRFNPRSRMGSDPLGHDMFFNGIGFNPRSRMGSDYPESGCFQEFPVSIHAPAWGATLTLLFTSPICCRFNPRSRMGSDKMAQKRISSMLVSIHAPAWGATSAPARLAPRTKFQSTLPHGERLSEGCG